ncbi:hypothetical protein D3C86_1906220 [compost metagenome]
MNRDRQSGLLQCRFVVLDDVRCYIKQLDLLRILSELPAVCTSKEQHIIDKGRQALQFFQV